MAHYEYFDEFQLLAEKDEYLAEFKERYNDFAIVENIEQWSLNENVIFNAIESCLERGFENEAIRIFKINFVKIRENTVDIAIKNDCLDFLKQIWESFFKPKNDELLFEKTKVTKGRKSIRSKTLFRFESSNKTKLKTKTGIFQNLNLFKARVETDFKVVDLVKRLHEEGKSVFKIISTWSNLDNEENLLETLFRLEYFEEVAILVFQKKSGNLVFTVKQFETVIRKEEFTLILHYIRQLNCRVLLDNPDTQALIVSQYMKYGHKLYYGAEMLNYVAATSWSGNLTRPLCAAIEKVIKKKEILNCHSPILTCLLLSEFLRRIGEVNTQHKMRCESIIKQLMDFSRNIQTSNPMEKYIKFLMSQKDSKGRNCFQIAADGEFYAVLETPEVGTIVKKMWNGKVSSDSIENASTLYKFVALSGSGLPESNFGSIDESKQYPFMLDVWTHSSSLRYYPECLSTVGLILLFNMIIYYMVNEDHVVTHTNNLPSYLKLMVYVYIFWAFSIVMNIFNLRLFCYLTGRKFILDIWQVFECLMFGSALLLLYDCNSLADGGVSDNKSDLAYLTRASILAVNDIFVWGRITGILLTFKNIGPLIRMIYLMSRLITKYLFIYGLYVACCASIFTSIFYDSSPQFEKYSVTIATLFSMFINNFDALDFQKNEYFGPVMIAVNSTISAVMLTNLLIAILSNMYSELSTEVDASYRSVLISYYRRYKWDNKFGYMIFLTPPLNLVNFIFFPVAFFLRKSNLLQPFNRLVSSLYYMLYLFFTLGYWLMLNCVLIPICYCKGLFYAVTVKESFMWATFRWMVIGVPLLLFFIGRDLWFILSNIFVKAPHPQTELDRIKRFIKAEDVVIFLRYIHSIRQEEPSDLHSLFFNYLNYYNEYKMKSDKAFAERHKYIEKINSKLGKGRKALLLVGAQDRKKGESIIANNFIKKNLIIIEILENFLINDGSDNYIVDTEKLKLLLPKTVTVTNEYIRRLVFTNISSLNKAVNKLRNKKNKMAQAETLTKLESFARKFSGNVDKKTLSLVGKAASTRVKIAEIMYDAQYDSEKIDILANIQREIEKTLLLKKQQLEGN